MKLKLTYLFVAFTLVATTLTSCKKDPVPETTSGNGQVKVKLFHHWGMESDKFEMNTSYVHPMNGDNMSFTTYKYYISNFRLKKADGTWWKHPESYFLVDLSNDASTSLSLGSVPAGEYVEMSYVLGVDSLRNVSGAQTGALAASNDMFWSWSTGYVMIKAEGQSPQSSTGNFAFHLGGFTGQYNVVASKSVTFSNPLTVTKDKTSEVHFDVNTAMTWCTSGSCAGTSSVMMPGALSYQMATDFHNGFNFDHIVE